MKPGHHDHGRLIVTGRNSVPDGIDSGRVDRLENAVLHFHLAAGGPVTVLERIGHDVEVGQHDPFGNAGGTAGIGKVRKIFFYIHGYFLVER